MNKSTIMLLVIAALGLGSLIGVSLVETDEPAVASVDGAASAIDAPVGSTGGAPRFRYLAPGDVAFVTDEFGQPEPAAPGENFIAQDRPWKSESVTFELPLDGATEYKAIMSQGDTIVFNWTTDGGQAYYDFHAHDEAFGEEFFTRYDEGEGESGAGAIVAAYNGQHGWYWLNLAEGPTSITLNIAGYFDEIVEIEIEGY